jgi:hypothetical protein
MTRCITAWALSTPQWEAMTSNRGFGRGRLGGGDHGEAELCRLMAAVAVVWRIVWTLAMPSGAVVLVVAAVCLCIWGNPE